jgi:hypothetical protein
MNELIQQLEIAERRRTVQSRVVISCYEEMKKSMLKKAIAKDLEPVHALMNLFSDEMNAQNELLMKLAEGVK